MKIYKNFHFHLNKLDGGLSALHVQGLGHVPALGELAGDGVEGARPLVQLVDRVEGEGLRSVGQQLGVSLNMSTIGENWKKRLIFHTFVKFLRSES